MEILIFIVVIIVACLLLNVNINYIFFGMIIIMGIFFALLAVGFAYCCIDLTRCRRCVAQFKGFEKVKERKYESACYLVEGTVIPCFFPRELVLHNKLYSKDKNYFVFVNVRKNRLYDRFAVTTCILGLVLSAVFVYIGISFAIYIL